MREFRCPACDRCTITVRQKWASSSFSPVTCPECRAEVYASGNQTAMWRMAEALMVTLVILLAFITGAFGMLLLAALIVVAMEALRLLLVPLVRLERVGGGFR